MRLLIADSDHTLADIYESFFCNEGYDVEIVEDGLQCLSATRRRIPDALILEYELPWGGGDGVLARLREEYSFVPLGVVMITCDYSVEELADHLEPPVVGCLRKPFRLRQLAEIVRSISQPQTAADAGGLLKDLTGHSRRVVQQ